MRIRDDGALVCSTCSELHSLGVDVEERVELEPCWKKLGAGVRSSGDNLRTKKSSLRNKMKRHNDSRAHQSAVSIIDKRKKEAWKTCADKLIHKDASSTEKIFRSVYFLAKSNRPFSDHPDICELQQLNGVDLGVTLHSRFSANAIVETISRIMCDNLCSFICSHNVKITVLLDESTTVSHKSTMIVYLRVSSLSFPGGQDDSAITFPLELVELDSLDAQTITLALLAVLTRHGFNEAYLSANLVGACSDGASTMLGRRSGVLTRLKQQFPRVQLWHCMCHRIELAIGDSVKDQTEINHMQIFMDKLYSLSTPPVQAGSEG